MYMKKERREKKKADKTRVKKAKESGKTKTVKKIDKAEKTAAHRKWFESQYTATIHLEDFINKIKQTDLSVLCDMLTKYFYPYGTIWRFDAALIFKYSVIPKKTEYIATAFKINRLRKTKYDTIEFHTNYAFTYSYIPESRLGAKVHRFNHEYVCISPTFTSADGEYRRSVNTFDMIYESMKKYSHVMNVIEEHVIKWCTSGEIALQTTTIYPHYICEHVSLERVKRDFEEQLNCERLVIKLLCIAWIQERFSKYVGVFENHLARGYHLALFGEEDDATVIDLFEDKKIFNDVIELRQKSIHFYDNIDRRVNIAALGQKFIPLTIKDVEEYGSPKLNTWREVYIGQLVSDVIINGITPSVPIFVDWCLLEANDKEMYDNTITNVRLDHSYLAKEIVKSLEAARSHTFKMDKKDKEQYINEKFKEISEVIQYPIDITEKELLMSKYILCTFTEHVSWTVGDLPKRYGKAWYRSGLGEMFSNEICYKKYIFEFIYGLYAINLKCGVIHTDLHLNNITLGLGRSITKINEFSDLMSESIIRNPHVIYDLSIGEGAEKNAEDIFVFPYWGRYSCIIDFSRGVVDRWRLEKDFSEAVAGDVISHQRRRLLRVIADDMPDFYESYALELEALVLRNFDLAWKLCTALDTFKIIRGFMGFMDARKVLYSEEIYVFTKSIKDMVHRDLIRNFQSAFEGKIVRPEDVEFYNRTLLLTMFNDCRLGAVKMPDDMTPLRPGERGNVPYTIIDVFQINNPMEFSYKGFDNLPELLRLDYLRKHDIDEMKLGISIYDKYVKYSKKRDDPVEELKEEYVANRAERRRTGGKEESNDRGYTETYKRVLASGEKVEMSREEFVRVFGESSS